MDPKAVKQQLRSRIIEERKALPDALRREYSARACRHAAEHERLAGARAIMAFHPFGAELDILPFIEKAKARGQEIWLPLTLTAERRLIPYRYEGKHMLKQGVYGIWEPDPALAEEADLTKLDAVLVPGVAFDRHGGRMGYGGGFYDRFLAGLQPRPLLVGIAFSMQLVDQVPREMHDIGLDGVVTENGFFQT
ncbi:5-formyltetrahydrofolate cyclo-ligase [Brevibacillus choshinensis]|uniref:5-formyltetrahydrofolate cyclo-ligase n=1 Tax=Brevibacillus choshinensis TaxID=54911 RepID=A0ABX7FX96_BRECH|nr:5-formyltetrahydrofolate cyclo-ligase [Brevibacillus choshinensis]QRG70425.1 5-formyltetrahydrofolate cyclo-ligase [Brevibacillus choshinensis]